MLPLVSFFLCCLFDLDCPEWCSLHSGDNLNHFSRQLHPNICQLPHWHNLRYGFSFLPVHFSHDLSSIPDISLTAVRNQTVRTFLNHTYTYYWWRSDKNHKCGLWFSLQRETDSINLRLHPIITIKYDSSELKSLMYSVCYNQLAFQRRCQRHIFFFISLCRPVTADTLIRRPWTKTSLNFFHLHLSLLFFKTHSDSKKVVNPACGCHLLWTMCCSWLHMAVLWCWGRHRPWEIIPEMLEERKEEASLGDGGEAGGGSSKVGSGSTAEFDGGDMEGKANRTGKKICTDGVNDTGGIKSEWKVWKKSHTLLWYLTVGLECVSVLLTDLNEGRGCENKWWDIDFTAMTQRNQIIFHFKFVRNKTAPNISSCVTQLFGFHCCQSVREKITFSPQLSIKSISSFWQSCENKKNIFLVW